MQYLVESHHTMAGPMMPPQGTRCLPVHSYALAVSLATKSFTIPRGNEIRVVHVSSGEVVFSKSSS
jgi:hypothetical protein